MNKFLSKKLSGLKPYVAGEQPKDQKYIKLNTNENPYPPSKKVKEAVDMVNIDSLSLYPDPDSTDIKEAVANLYNIQAENVFPSNSSDEILALAFMAFFQNDKPIAFPEISYSFYPVYCDLYGIERNLIPLKDDFSIDIESFPLENGGIIFPNPNAPTGKDLSLLEIEKLVRNNPDSVVIIDEAYVDFGAETSVPLTSKYNNVLVIQTLSKSRSLAGLRVGFAIGSKELIDCLNAVKNSFNSYTIDKIAIAASVAAIKDTEHFNSCCQKIINTREWVTLQLRELGFKVLPSKANFILASPMDLYNAQDLYLNLKSKGILIRYWNQPKIKDWCRITVGTMFEMETLVATIKELLK